MYGIEKRISIFNENLNRLKGVDLKINDIIPQMEKEIIKIFSDIKSLHLKKDNEELLINTLLTNIDTQRGNLYGDIETFSKSKLYIELLGLLESYITVHKTDLENILQAQQKEIIIIEDCSELLKKEENSKKLSELRKNKDRKVIEIRFVEDDIIPKHKEYQGKISNIIDGFELSKDDYIDKNKRIKDILTSLGGMLHDLSNVVKERENYLKLNMYNNYMIRELENFFRLIHKEITNIKNADAASIPFLTTFPKSKDRINQLLESLLKTIVEKNKDTENLYKQLQKQIETLEK